MTETQGASFFQKRQACYGTISDFIFLSQDLGTWKFMETQHKCRETKMCVFGHAYRCVVMLSDA